MWAALVGTFTGLVVVGFHELLRLINNFLFGPFVEGLLIIGRSPGANVASDLPQVDLPPLGAEAGTPLAALLQLGLGGIGFLPVTEIPEPPPSLAGAGGPDLLSLWPVVVVPTLGGLAVGLLRRRATDLGPGLPGLMAAADGAPGILPRFPWLRILTASLSLGSGASLGPEGPSVEGGGNIGLWLAQRGALSPQSRRTLVSAGVAAGLAAGFRAPIAGVFFAFEGSVSAAPERPGLRAVLVAAIASTLVTQLLLGDDPMLRLPAYEVRSLLELPLYMGLGLLASLLSLVLLRLLAAGRSPRVQELLAALPLGLPTALGGALVGGMALAFPQVLGVGYDTIEALLGRDGGVALVTLLALVGMKLLATTISNACGFVGGGFAPALMLGAVMGNAYGQLLGEQGLHLPIAEPPAYAMVGMAAVLAGSARAPLTSLLLLFELTRDIRIVLPLMAAAGMSTLLVERWQGLQDPGLLGADLREERRRTELAAIGIAEALEPDAPLVLPGTLGAQEALSILVDAHGHCLIVAAGDHVQGIVTLSDLQRGMSLREEQKSPVLLQDCLRSELIWLPDDSSLDRLEDQLRPNGLRQVPVFEIPEGIKSQLPHGLPPQGLSCSRLRGYASRDGLARALARSRHSMRE